MIAKTNNLQTLMSESIEKVKIFIHFSNDAASKDSDKPGIKKTVSLDHRCLNIITQEDLLVTFGFEEISERSSSQLGVLQFPRLKDFVSRFFIENFYDISRFEEMETFVSLFSKHNMSLLAPLEAKEQKTNLALIFYGHKGSNKAERLLGTETGLIPVLIEFLETIEGKLKDLSFSFRVFEVQNDSIVSVGELPPTTITEVGDWKPLGQLQKVILENFYQTLVLTRSLTDSQEKLSSLSSFGDDVVREGYESEGSSLKRSRELKKLRKQASKEQLIPDVNKKTFLIRIRISSGGIIDSCYIDLFVLEDSENNRKSYIFGDQLVDVKDSNQNLMMFNNLVTLLSSRNPRKDQKTAEKNKQNLRFIAKNALTRHCRKYFLGNYKTAFVSLLSSQIEYENEILNALAVSTRVGYLIQPAGVTLRRTPLLDAILSEQERNLIHLAKSDESDFSTLLENYSQSSFAQVKTYDQIQASLPSLKTTIVVEEPRSPSPAREEPRIKFPEKINFPQSIVHPFEKTGAFGADSFSKTINYQNINIEDPIISLESGTEQISEIQDKNNEVSFDRSYLTLLDFKKEKSRPSAKEQNSTQILNPPSNLFAKNENHPIKDVNKKVLQRLNNSSLIKQFQMFNDSRIFKTFSIYEPEIIIVISHRVLFQKLVLPIFFSSYKSKTKIFKLKLPLVIQSFTSEETIQIETKEPAFSSTNTNDKNQLNTEQFLNMSTNSCSSKTEDKKQAIHETTPKEPLKEKIDENFYDLAHKSFMQLEEIDAVADIDHLTNLIPKLSFQKSKVLAPIELPVLLFGTAESEKSEHNTSQLSPVKITENKQKFLNELPQKEICSNSRLLIQSKQEKPKSKKLSQLKISPSTFFNRTSEKVTPKLPKMSSISPELNSWLMRQISDNSTISKELQNAMLKRHSARVILRAWRKFRKSGRKAITQNVRMKLLRSKLYLKACNKALGDILCDIYKTIQ